MKLFNRKAARAAASLLAVSMTLTSVNLPVLAAQSAASSSLPSAAIETGKLALPSAGISYALSTQKISLREVEDSLYERGLVETRHVVPNQTQSVVSAAVSSIFKSGKDQDSTEADSADTNSSADLSSAADSGAASPANDSSNTNSSNPDTDSVASASGTVTAVSDGAVSSDNTSAVDSSTTDDNTQSAILQTNLTPVQMKEESLVKSSSNELAGVDESTATSLSTGAVSVVSSSQDALARKQAEDAEAAARAKAAQEAQKAAEEARIATEKAQQEAEAKAAEEQKAQEEAEQKAKENPLVVSTANDYVNVRKEPSEDSEIVGKLYTKDVGKVQEEADENGWIKITSGDVTGYVKQDYVATGTQAQELADSVGTQKAVVNTETLLVRAAADPNSDVIDLVGMGSALNIISEENGWYKVNTDVGEGYISSDFTDVEVEYPQAVSKEEEEAALAAQKAEEEAAAKKAEEEAAAKAAEEAAAAASSQKATASSSTQSTSGASGNSTAQSSTTTASTTQTSAATTTQETTTVTTSSGSGKGQEVVNYALQFVGNPYVWGGSSLTNGTDCSGFTMAVYAHFGVSLPHYDASQRSVGIAVGSLSEAQPGDLICYYGHVGIYIGNGQIVHASNPRDGIKVSSANYRSIAAIRRIFY